MKKLPKHEWEWVECELGYINPLFKEMWLRFEPMIFDKDTETAELELHNNNFRIVANPKFWKSCDRYKQIFIICHEMCHVMFGHWLIDPKMNREWCNIAQDIQVNEFLLHLHFNRMRLAGDDFVTLELVFKDKANLVKNSQDYRYYYELLMQCAS